MERVGHGGRDGSGVGSGDDPTAAGKYEMIIERTQITRVYEDAHYFARTWIPASDGRYRVAFHGVTGINGSNINIDELHLYSVERPAGLQLWQT